VKPVASTAADPHPPKGAAMPDPRPDPPLQPPSDPLSELPSDSLAAPVVADRVEQPGGVPERLAAQIRFILEVDQLKAVLRRSPLLAAARRENDAEHSWHLALMVLLLAEYADEPVDVALTLSLVIVHDLVEIYAGDTFVYDEAGCADQAERERRAADRLFALLPDDQAGWLRRLWDEFEERATPEARFAKAMDRLQPLLLNFNGGGGTWRTPGVTEADVRDRKAVIGDASETLWEYGQQLIDAGVRRGWLAPAGAPAPPAAAGSPASPAGAGSPVGIGRDGGGEAVG
jgi:putative hydrolase of HD superfamily